MGSRPLGKPSAATARQAGHPWPAWFQDSVQHAQLLTNRTLREYLLAHSAERWPEVAKATLLYGVLCLRRDFPGQPALPLEALHEAARQLHAQAALGTALPDIRARFDSLEAELGGCLAELGDAAGCGGEPAQEVAPTARGRQQAAAAPASRAHSAAASVAGWQRGAPPARASGSGSSAPARASAHVAEPPLPPPPRPRASKGADIYPDWWPGDTRRAAGPARQRPQPRLAYSRPPTAPPSVTQDDLPTAAFLLVPPRVSTAGGPGGARGDAPSPQAAPRSRPPLAAQSRIKLQHAQRLALRRQEPEGQEERPANWPGGGRASLEHAGACGGGVAERAEHGGSGGAHAGALPGSPRCAPEAMARWMRHFGLGGERGGS